MIEQVRQLLGLAADVTDEEVWTAYAAYLNGGAAEPPLLTLAEAKVQLRLPPGTSDEDPHLESLIDTAGAVIRRRLGGRIVEPAGRWPTLASVPADVVHAAKAIVAELYANREADVAAMPIVELLIGDYARVAFA